MNSSGVQWWFQLCQQLVLVETGSSAFEICYLLFLGISVSTLVLLSSHCLFAYGPWLVIFIVVVLILFTFGTIVNLFYYILSILSLCQRVISYVSQ